MADGAKIAGLLGKGLGINLNANLNQGYSQSANSGGSVNSAESFNNSYNESWNEAYSNSQAWTDADTARMYSALAAEWAWQKNMEAMQKQMDFNKEEAQKQREWQAEMANTIYTRSIKNMKEAGINPILASNMGLSGASVGSGATASLSGVPSAPLAQNFMDSWSASESYSHGGSYGYGEGGSNESGSGWNYGWTNSEEGIATALHALGDMASGAWGAINSSNALNNARKGWDKASDLVRQGVNKINKGITTKIENIKKDIKDLIEKNGGGGHGF